MKTIRQIDLNADVGEGYEIESQIMPYLTSCNIACGGHFGDYNSMLATINLAEMNRVKIGAHPSYSDRLNFGRKIIEIDPPKLFTELKEQVESLLKILENKGLKLNHIKAHGALYNQSAKSEKEAQVLIDLSQHFCTPLYLPYNSAIEKLAIKNKVPFKYEAFADRLYNSDASLVSRLLSNSSISDPQIASEQVISLMEKGGVISVDSKFVKIEADTICVHGDNIKAVDILKHLSFALNNMGYKLK